MPESRTPTTGRRGSGSWWHLRFHNTRRWRRKLIFRLNRARYRRQFIVPKVKDPEEAGVKSKDSANVWEFTIDGLPIGLKRLKLYTKLFSDAQKKIYEQYNGDPSRLYVQNMIINYKPPMKQIKYHALRNFGIMSTWRNSIVYRIREMPMNEFYQKIFILGRIPKSMGAEMRAALYEKRVPAQTVTEWYPYLTAHTRFFFRRQLKWMNDTGQFNYYKHRRDWIEQYNSNLRRKIQEARDERGMV
ncbi:50S ribosomal protein [Babesia ovata]|uniref:50S ribosomal protein n=1 Tax=Babesia ovata TaxID=189622 RepID=A0A2H6KGI9_9APIC|nr:50S ribosomal protein [Babesia ovata]GBE62113.1 50S ribosomal protein [Babesia ovata]